MSIKESKEKYQLKIPENLPLVENGDLVKRNLDCAVIETIHQFNEYKKKPEFDSVRGVFFEGEELYENAGFKEKNHIQIAPFIRAIKRTIPHPVKKIELADKK